jgi:release factor glutamine methyltransferase
VPHSAHTIHDVPAISVPDRLAPLLQRTVEAAAQSLGEVGCQAPVDEALTLVASALGVPPTELAHVTDIPPAAHREIDARLERRRQREPLEYICGRCRYRGLELEIDHRALIPSENTGPLVELALGLPRGSRVHDVGTGSGAIALAVKAERSDLIVSGSDISPAAIAVAEGNARRLRIDVAFAVHDGVPDGSFDLVLANLPYQGESAEVVSLPPETTNYQPHVAVFGGPDGLGVIKRFVQSAPRGVRVGLQHAPSQAFAVRAMLREARTLDGADDMASWTIGRTQ